jgi:hypothetical protein
LLDSDSEIARDRASSFVLGLAGIQPPTTPSVSLNLEIRAGYIIDVSPEPGEGVDRLPGRNDLDADQHILDPERKVAGDITASHGQLVLAMVPARRLRRLFEP